MRKLDILMIKSFIGPFLLTTAVSNFILLIQYLLKYFDDFVGKNLGFAVFAELLFYFSLNMLQVALPLGVLVASLMTFGNLGENFELTAIKGSGISLLRTLRPIFLFVVVLSIGAFFFNNYAIPAANLKAYSLLYDIKHTKPALDIKAGSFYNGIPNYSIKAKEKLPDGKTLLDVIIYDHTNARGNKTVILSDSSLMYTILDDRYLKLELYNGNYYSEQTKKKSKVDQLYRTKYYRMDMVFSLASFDLKRRKEELFQNNRQMKNISELTTDIDSFGTVITKAKASLIQNTNRFFNYHIKNKTQILEKQKKEAPLDTLKGGFKREELASLLPLSFFELFSPSQDTLKPKRDSIRVGNVKRKLLRDRSAIKKNAVNDKVVKPMLQDKKKPILSEESLKIQRPPGALAVDSTEIDASSSVRRNKRSRARNDDGKEKKVKEKTVEFKLDTVGWVFLDSLLAQKKRLRKKTIITNALHQARNIKVNVQSTQTRVYKAQKDQNLYTIEKYKKYAQALACILMFMIGAPLGAIIKKGGLGVPTIIAILFFIIYYVFTSIGEKSAKEGAMNPYFAVWLSDIVLLPFGLIFLQQARVDARLFEWESYILWFFKMRTKIKDWLITTIILDGEKEEKKDDSGADDLINLG